MSLLVLVLWRMKKYCTADQMYNVDETALSTVHKVIAQKEHQMGTITKE